ncbi:MAG: F420-0:Gamma-glutamyl ligase [Acidimicrobiales bacterium]|nr:F420-0:Gamma-glutamyl ligase [Acidimicrobiales bacterium]
MTDLRTLYRHLEPALHPAGNAASFTNEDWAVERDAGAMRIRATVRVTNRAGDREVMLFDVMPETQLLAEGSVDGLTVRTEVRSLDPDYPPRPDRYWTAFVVKPHKSAAFEVEVVVTGLLDGAADPGLYAVCVLLRIDTYGAEGLRRRVHHVVLPLRLVEPAPSLQWQDADDGRLQVAAVRTHLLTPVDDPVEVARRYASAHARPGDVLAIGESPLAVMQGRFRHPSEVRVSWLTHRLCYLLSGTGSLGTAPGLQTLIDLVGVRRVLWALARGASGKLAGRNGDFYRTLGEQSRLIDDVTGTLPPYDRFLVLGPVRADEAARAVGRAIGIDVAVVDANDLGFVDVIGATDGVDPAMVAAALRRNPAGNGAESTPLVLIRRQE